jgi:hypothetical protein
VDALLKLHQTLKVAGSLLDSSASQIRDAALSPTKDHIYSIGKCLAEIFEIQQAIYKLRPELEEVYEEPPHEIQEANRRLGETLISAYDLADSGQVPEAIALLDSYSKTEPSEFHRELATNEIERLAGNYGS